VDPTTKPDDAKVIFSTVAEGGSTPPEREIIDLTIKEESRPATPIPPPRASQSDEDPAGLEAGWVSSPEILELLSL
jgi:hypothetical protein